MQAVKSKLASLKAKLSESEAAAQQAEEELNEVQQKTEEEENLVSPFYFLFKYFIYILRNFGDPLSKLANNVTLIFI